MTQHWTERLSEYLDDEMTAQERADLEGHLVACPECADVLDELREVVAAAAALPPHPPARDLWRGIEARLTPRERTAVQPDILQLPGARGRRRVVMTVPQLLAAGIAVVALSTGTVLGVLSLRTGAAAGIAAVEETGGAAVSEASSDVPVAQFTVAYEQAITELETEFERRREALDPRTVVVVERNLAIIDGAIAEARKALETDPSSGFLSTHLANAMRQKVELLRRVAKIERTEI